MYVVVILGRWSRMGYRGAVRETGIKETWCVGILFGRGNQYGAA